MSEMLDQMLEKYGQSSVYPFHMPGHKRQSMGMADPCQIDITEIHGFDNLHDPKGPILEAMEHLARLYESKNSYFLVNGSTCGNLAAIFSAAGQGEELLIGRNAHQSVYHGAYLRRSRLRYLYPAPAANGMLQGEILPGDVQRALEEFPSVKAVMITSPTYEGVVSDIRAIAKICHEHDVPLIVDAAHGAHLGFHPYFPQSPVKQGADAVIMSLHKTLPSLTQTAVLHLQGNRIRKETCERYLRIFQSSSPSYVLMAGMVKCVRYLEMEGKKRFEEFTENLEDFYQQTAGLAALWVWNPKTAEEMSGIFERDPSKLVIFTGGSGITGEELSERLREDYALELEMSASDYALAMTSLMDSRKGFARLAEALLEIDRTLEKEPSPEEKPAEFLESQQAMNEPGHQVMELWEAMDADTEYVPFDQAAGRVAAEMVSVYPPGIPALVPGERITERQQEGIQRALDDGLTVQGVRRRDGQLWIRAVEENRR